jgi:mRNA-degrading endonuclease RelE of RelBE toxin-antitoxin system
MGSYSVRVQPEAKKEVRNLPGNMRQRVWRALRALEQEPRPRNSQALDTKKANLKLDAGVELRRIRIESWRIVYAVEDDWEHVIVMTILKRPPYDYGDLPELLAQAE